LNPVADRFWLGWLGCWPFQLPVCRSPPRSLPLGGFSPPRPPDFSPPRPPAGFSPPRVDCSCWIFLLSSVIVPCRGNCLLGSSLNDGTTQTVLDPLGRGPVLSPWAVLLDAIPVALGFAKPFAIQSHSCFASSTERSLIDATSTAQSVRTCRSHLQESPSRTFAPSELPTIAARCAALVGHSCRTPRCCALPCASAVSLDRSAW
jgi:hypothetical protein